MVDRFDLHPVSPVSLVVVESRVAKYASQVATFHDCARSPAVRRFQTLEADQFHSDRL